MENQEEIKEEPMVDTETQRIPEDNISIEQLEDAPEQSGGIDLTQFEGTRCVIEKVEVIDSISSYDETGHFKEGLQRPVKKLKVATVPLTETTKEDGTKIEFRATEIFNLNLVDKKWMVSIHEKAKITRFLKKLGLPPGIVGVKQLKGKTVTVTLTPPNDEGKTYLGIVH